MQLLIAVHKLPATMPIKTNTNAPWLKFIGHTNGLADDVVMASTRLGRALNTQINKPVIMPCNAVVTAGNAR